MKVLIPYLCIILLNVYNCRYKRINYGRYDAHDLLCIGLSIIGVCVILL